MARVVNKHKEAYDVYIGRGSLWGNPFVMGKDGTREEVVAKYKRYIWDKYRAGDITAEQILALDGKRLGCFCAPQACHGDVLVGFINFLKDR